MRGARLLPRVDGEAHEFEFTEEDFGRIRRWLYDHAGIHLRDHKMHMVYSRLSRRLRTLNFTRFRDYLNFVGQDAQEWERFVNALTTNLTQFFREAHHFQTLAAQAQAALTARTVSREKPFEVWCAAASTGEEAYSIAIALLETLGDGAPIKILASDIDTDVLKKAAAGVYGLERLRTLDETRRKRFFLKGVGPNTGFARVRGEVCATIEFARINLLETDAWPTRKFDAVFCRNVMIYFDKPTQRRLLERFAATLRPDGLFYAGHSESLQHAADLFSARGRTVYALKTGGSK